MDFFFTKIYLNSLTSTAIGLSASTVSTCGTGTANVIEHNAISIIAKHFHINPSILIVSRLYAWQCICNWSWENKKKNNEKTQFGKRITDKMHLYVYEIFDCVIRWFPLPRRDCCQFIFTTFYSTHGHQMIDVWNWQGSEPCVLVRDRKWTLNLPILPTYRQTAKRKRKKKKKNTATHVLSTEKSE